MNTTRTNTPQAGIATSAGDAPQAGAVAAPCRPSPATRPSSPAGARPARALVAAAAVGVLALVAAACGGDDGDDAAAAPSVPLEQDQDAAPEPVEEEPPSTVEPPSDDEQPSTVEPASDDEPASTPESAVEAPPAGPPHVAELAWGNFVLSERIAAKLAAGERLNFVVSLTATGDSGTAGSFEHGWSRAAASAAEEHGTEINARVIGPTSADAEAQAATVESLIASGDIDCLAVEAAGPRLLGGVIDNAVDAGIPVFAVNGDTPDSKRFAFYGIDGYGAGQAVGSQVGRWAADGGILVRRAGVLTGDAGDQQSFDLMRGFVAGLSEIHSGVEWVNSPTDVDSFGFDPFAVYDATEAWVLDNIDVDIVFHTDQGLEEVAAVIADQLLYGDMYAVGLHMSERVADYIRERVVVAAAVPGLAQQARLAGAACGDFLLGGTHDTGHVVFEPTAVTRDNVDDADWALPENL